jgi:hypothetical protein
MRSLRVNLHDLVYRDTNMVMAFMPALKLGERDTAPICVALPAAQEGDATRCEPGPGTEAAGTAVRGMGTSGAGGTVVVPGVVHREDVAEHGRCGDDGDDERYKGRLISIHTPFEESMTYPLGDT